MARMLEQHKSMSCPMKKNITLKLDTNTLREVRIIAAEKGTSISGLLSAKLQEIVREQKKYDRARSRALARLSSLHP